MPDCNDTSRLLYLETEPLQDLQFLSRHDKIHIYSRIPGLSTTVKYNFELLFLEQNLPLPLNQVTRNAPKRFLYLYIWVFVCSFKPGKVALRLIAFPFYLKPTITSIPHMHLWLKKKKPDNVLIPQRLILTLQLLLCFPKMYLFAEPKSTVINRLPYIKYILIYRYFILINNKNSPVKCERRKENFTNKLINHK